MWSPEAWSLCSRSCGGGGRNFHIFFEGICVFVEEVERFLIGKPFLGIFYLRLRVFGDLKTFAGEQRRRLACTIKLTERNVTQEVVP